jgi:hypothetical protein
MRWREIRQLFKMLSKSSGEMNSVEGLEGQGTDEPSKGKELVRECMDGEFCRDQMWINLLNPLHISCASRSVDCNLCQSVDNGDYIIYYNNTFY